MLATARGAAVVLPGPPAELRRLWPRALETEAVQRVLERARPPEVRVLRLYGVSESAVARALADAGGDGDGVEATICARDFEIHVDLLIDQGGQARTRADELEAALAEWLAPYLFARDEQPVEELVLEACRSRGWTLATAESSTGGLVAARLTSVPGASDVFVGGIVAYSNELKTSELDVSEELLRRHGAVSPEVASAMAAGGFMDPARAEFQLRLVKHPLWGPYQYTYLLGRKLVEEGDRRARARGAEKAYLEYLYSGLHTPQSFLPGLDQLLGR